MRAQATRRDAYQLLHEGAQALVDAQQNGICVDVPYYEGLLGKKGLLGGKLTAMKNGLMQDPNVLKWRRIAGSKFKLSSDQQLASLLFDHMGLKPPELTGKGNYTVKSEVIESLSKDLPFLSTIIRIRKLTTARDQIAGILRETVDGVLHPFFNLNTAVTYRSSSSGPNFQNKPVRDKEIAEIVRRGMRGHKGHAIGETDYKGLEVGASAFYHKDPTLITDICDPKRDMHRDMAMECYLLRLKQMTKDIRYCGKNKFVFPEFYGDYYKSCASALWSAVEEMNLVTADGTPLRQHLSQKGFRKLTQYEKHIEAVENRFWNERYAVYGKWKKDWVSKYDRLGFLDMLTGFRCSGVSKRNEIVNYPIQGTAFHCLLWSMIQLNRWLKEEHMETKIIGQIHDSIVWSFHPDEMMAVLQKAQDIMCVAIRSHWKWINIPLEIEAEVSQPNGTWFEKKELKIAA